MNTAPYQSKLHRPPGRPLSVVALRPAPGIIGLALCCLQCTAAWSADVATASERLRLRNETATHYTRPEAHLKLARYHYEAGNKIQAFYIAEFARRMFGDEEFTPAFHKVAALKLTNSYAVTNAVELSQYSHDHPDSLEARLLALDRLLKDRPRGKVAARSVEALLADFPRHVAPKAAAARYFLKVNRDEQRALGLYLDLYFYDPHYYDGEYAEFRIKEIASAHKESWWKVRNRSGLPLRQWVAKEKNPRVLDGFLKESRDRWDASLVPVMFTMFENDDPAIQAGALHVLLEHPREVPREAILRMLKGDDLVQRAIAAFLVVKCLTPDEFPVLQDNLQSGIELIQIDTMQALARMGGPGGLKYLKGHPPAKMSARVKEVWQSVVSQQDNQGKTVQ